MNLERELSRFDDTLPLERASTPPASWYTSEAFHRLERGVFAGSWQLVGHRAQLTESGRFIAGTIAAQPYVVLNDGGVLRAFHNVCRHKGTPVAVGEQGCLDQLTCPYHGWVYGLDGRLKRAPQLGGIKDFDRAEFGLAPMRVETWGPLVLVAADPDVPDLVSWLGGLQTRLEATGWAALRHRASGRYELDCNWKVFADNYLDGGYHIAHMHPGLAAQLDLDRYETELLERSSVQTCPGVDEVRVGDQAFYAWVYPNLMLNRYGPVLDTNLVLPLGPERCEVRFEYFFAEGVEDDWIAASIANTDQTQREDIQISEWVQQGMRSPAFDRGRYAPAREKGIYQFHRLLAADLRRYFSSESF